MFLPVAPCKKGPIFKLSKAGLHSNLVDSDSCYGVIEAFFTGAARGGHIRLLEKALEMGAQTLNPGCVFKAAARGNQPFVMHWLATYLKMSFADRHEFLPSMWVKVQSEAVATFDLATLYENFPSNVKADSDFIVRGAIRGGHIELVKAFPPVTNGLLCASLKAAIRGKCTPLIEEYSLRIIEEISDVNERIDIWITCIVLFNKLGNTCYPKFSNYLLADWELSRTGVRYIREITVTDVLRDLDVLTNGPYTYPTYETMEDVYKEIDRRSLC